MVRVTGDEIGVEFLARDKTKKSLKRNDPHLA
jgi:hypothetical protein